jgi:hypothetical protein
MVQIHDSSVFADAGDGVDVQTVVGSQPGSMRYHGRLRSILVCCVHPGLVYSGCLSAPSSEFEQPHLELSIAGHVLLLFGYGRSSRVQKEFCIACTDSTVHRIKCADCE